MNANIQQRASLLAEMFIRELNPFFLAQASYQGNRWDYIATFRTKTNPNLVITVDVMGTIVPLRSEFIFPASPHWVRSLNDTSDNLLILVINVLEDKIYWGWAKLAAVVRDPSVKGAALVRLPLVESNEASKAKLLAEIKAR